MFRWFRQDALCCRVCVNNFKLGDRKTADIACLDDPRMVGEVKILGRGYQRKVVTGTSRGLAVIRGRIHRPIGNRDRGASWIGPWGLVPDYFRLRSAQPDGEWERLLVLVADVGNADNDDVSQVLRAISFETTIRLRTLSLQRGFIRIWTL